VNTNRTGSKPPYSVENYNGNGISSFDDSRKYKGMCIISVLNFTKNGGKEGEEESKLTQMTIRMGSNSFFTTTRCTLQIIRMRNGKTHDFQSYDFVRTYQMNVSSL
jgi:hypothetical protein